MAPRKFFMTTLSHHVNLSIESPGADGAPSSQKRRRHDVKYFDWDRRLLDGNNPQRLQRALTALWALEDIYLAKIHGPVGYRLSGKALLNIGSRQRQEHGLTSDAIKNLTDGVALKTQELVSENGACADFEARTPQEIIEQLRRILAGLTVAVLKNKCKYAQPALMQAIIAIADTGLDFDRLFSDGEHIRFILKARMPASQDRPALERFAADRRVFPVPR